MARATCHRSRSSCDDSGSGSSIASICNDMCESEIECADMDEDEKGDCVDECKDSAADSSDEDCYSEGKSYYGCYYQALLDEDCDWMEAENDCDDEWDNFVDCGGSSSDSDVDSDADSDGDADSDSDSDYCGDDDCPIFSA